MRYTVLPQQKCGRCHLQHTWWTRNSTIATAVVTEEVLTAGMQQWRDASRMSSNHKVAPRYSLNRKYAALTRVVNGQTEHARMDIVIQPQRISHVSGCLYRCSLPLAVRPWSQQPAQDQDSWPKELRRTTSTDTHTSTSFLSSSRPQVDLVHTQENSSATPCEMPTTRHWPSGTPGQLSKVCFAVPSPNNSSQPSLRDLQ